MLKKVAGGGFASLRGSMYRNVRLFPSLAVALLDSLFEHPVGMLAFVVRETFQPACWRQSSFSATC